MRFILALAIVLLLASPVSADHRLPAAREPYPDLSPGGPERVVGLQGWWVGVDGGPGFGHIHADMVVPFGGEVKGTWRIPLRVILHNNPSKLHRIDIRMRDGEDSIPTALTSIRTDKTCPYDGTDDKECAWDFEPSIDTRKYPDGWKQLIVHVRTETPDNQVFRTSSRIPVKFNNGNKSNGDSFAERQIAVDLGCEKESFLALSWYGPTDEEGDYARAWGLCLPQGRVRDKIKIPIYGGERDEASRVVVKVSGGHEIPETGDWPAQRGREGKILLNRTRNLDEPVEVELDPRDFERGWHPFTVQVFHPNTAPSECDYCTDEENEQAGVAVYWIYMDSD